ncbi:MAG: Panacea domain-containing protein [Pseudomonadota bacterium]
MAGFNKEKTTAALLHLADKAGSMDLYALMKMFYWADKEHFQQFGRTITGDEYEAEPYGPLPSKIYYGMINSVRTDNIWDFDLAEHFVVEDNSVIPRKQPDYRKLSESDVAVLDRVYARHGDKGFDELEKAAHDDPTYIRFLRSKRARMTLEDMADGDPYLLKHLEEVKENERFLQDLRYLPPRNEENVC